MEKKKFRLWFSLCALALFVAWTVAVRYVDKEAIGPQGSCVGFATINASFHALTGVHMALYTITDWLGLVPIAVALYFAVTGFVQLIRRKSLFRVDSNILALGAFYLVVIGVFVFFEFVVVNYRPVLISGILEASYPSSTTMLAMSVMPTALLQCDRYLAKKTVRRVVKSAIAVFTAFMVLARLLSGVHWLTDIIGGVLISASLVVAYSLFCDEKPTDFD